MCCPCLTLSLFAHPQPELDDDWSVDVSEEAVQRRQAELTDGVKGLTINDDLEKAEKVGRPADTPRGVSRDAGGLVSSCRTGLGLREGLLQ